MSIPAMLCTLERQWNTSPDLVPLPLKVQRWRCIIGQMVSIFFTKKFKTWIPVVLGHCTNRQKNIFPVPRNMVSDSAQGRFSLWQKTFTSSEVLFIVLRPLMVVNLKARWDLIFSPNSPNMARDTIWGTEIRTQLYLTCQCRGSLRSGSWISLHSKLKAWSVTTSWSLAGSGSALGVQTSLSVILRAAWWSAGDWQDLWVTMRQQLAPVWCWSNWLSAGRTALGPVWAEVQFWSGRWTDYCQLDWDHIGAWVWSSMVLIMQTSSWSSANFGHHTWVSWRPWCDPNSATFSF